MRRASIIAVGLAGILSCHFHCVVHGATGARLLGAALTAAEQGEPVPVNGETPRTENESGCICKGAVLTGVAVVPALDLAGWHAELSLPLAPAAVSDPMAALAPLLASHPPDAPARISGRILRAWIASLVI